MTKRMLVDATHAEEVRVAVVQDQRLIDLDIETASREQIKGNIYLARVTRVEPSLQAAFVEFHNGRQGFLSINDIHPKYYPPEEPEREVKQTTETAKADSVEGNAASAKEGLVDEDELSEDFPPADEFRPRARRRHLPIQRLLTRGQTLLVQVVKEARSNKGASLTTHISLAGRYTVLLPENSGGGGISRKITDPLERKHLKEVLSSIEIPGHISLIIRTAGLGRTKREVARDMSYLLRLWKMIEDKAKQLKPPVLIHEEGDLIIRAIRDLYTTDMEEILIDGQEGYRIGKDFMRLLMPRYVKVVQPYKDSLPLFARYQIENQIESMHERKVPLRAGGYLVIDPTEALVTIDINSGRSTREKDVESTAFKTNLQAAEEIARQLRLRDLGGLVVIDFIDMDDRKHVGEVEKQLKDAFKQDRAKIQIGKISSFGLMELSRQRMKPTFNETSRLECPRCKGLGTIRSIESASIHLFRQLEEEVAKGRYSRLTYTTSQEMANYLQNNKRDQIRKMETEHDTIILIYGDSSLQTPEFHKNRVERTQEELDALELMQSKRLLVTAEPEEEESEPEYTPDDLDDLDDESDLQERESRKPPHKPVDVSVQVSDVVQTGHAPRSVESGSPGETEPETAEKPRRRRRRRKRPGVQPLPVSGSVASVEGRDEAETSGQTKTETPSISPVDGAVAVSHVPGLYVLGSAATTGAHSMTGAGEMVSSDSAPPVEGDGGLGTPAGEAPLTPTRRRRRRRRRSGQPRTLPGMEATTEQEEREEASLDYPLELPVVANQGMPEADVVLQQTAEWIPEVAEEPEVVQPEHADLEVVQSAVSASEVVDLESVPSKETVSEVVESVVVESAVVEPVVIESAVVEPAVVEPEVVEPVVIEPAVVESEVVEPEVVEPAVVEPAVVEPAVVVPPAEESEGVVGVVVPPQVAREPVEQTVEPTLSVSTGPDVSVVPEGDPLPTVAPKAKPTRVRATRRKVVKEVEAVQVEAVQPVKEEVVVQKKPRVYRRRVTKASTEAEAATGSVAGAVAPTPAKDADT